MALHLKKRGGKWYAVGRVLGRLRRISTGIPVNGRDEHDEAERRVASIELEIRAGRVGVVAKKDGAKKGASTYPTFAEWWAKYQSTYSQSKAASTRDREVYLIAPALELWGDRPLNDLHEVDGESYLIARRRAVNGRAAIARGLSTSTIAREVALLTSVFRKARTRYPELPVVLTTMKHRSPVRDRVVTAEEQIELLRRLPHRYRWLVLFFLGTGTRLAEALGLRETDIKWDKQQIEVTGKGNKKRRVPLQPAIAAVLRHQIAETGPRLWGLWRDKSVEAAFRRACLSRAAHGRCEGWPAMTPITPHTLRHTFGWRYLTGSGNRSKRGDIYALSKVLGHASVRITERHYAHLFDDDLRDAMLAVDVGVSAEDVDACVHTIDAEAWV